MEAEKLVTASSMWSSISSVSSSNSTPPPDTLMSCKSKQSACDILAKRYLNSIYCQFSPSKTK